MLRINEKFGKEYLIEHPSTSSERFTLVDNKVIRNRHDNYRNNGNEDSITEIGYKILVNDNQLSRKVSFSDSINSIKITKNPQKIFEKNLEFYKRKTLNLLVNEDIIVGYSSRCEEYLSDLISIESPMLVKELISQLYYENFENPDRIYKIIEIMSNLDYKTLKPMNTIIALGAVNYDDIKVQEAAVASLEKWEDPDNIKLLMNVKYSTRWIEEYAQEVIEYLESC